MAASFDDGESSLLLMMSIQLLTESKTRKVSPTLNVIAKHLAINLLVGGPGLHLHLHGRLQLI